VNPIPQAKAPTIVTVLGLLLATVGVPTSTGTLQLTLAILAGVTVAVHTIWSRWAHVRLHEAAVEAMHERAQLLSLEQLKAQPK
jgi:hypothetical protein